MVQSASRVHRKVWKEAQRFLVQAYREMEWGKHDLEERLDEVEAAIQEQGTYELTYEELAYGARVAWRNSVRCIGRLYWKSLHVFDARELRSAEEAYTALCEHLRFATNGGNIRSAITLFPPEQNGLTPLRILNHQLIRYAGYRQANGSILGDPASVDFTDMCLRLGWKGQGTAYDILPLVVQEEGKCPVWRDWPEDVKLEVPIEHPTLSAISELQLRWYAVPVISDMRLEIGGISFPAAPFNGWYMGTEVGARNLADEDRYNALPKIARALQLDTSRNDTLWKDRALLELNAAVLHSYKKQGVKIVDHHSAAEQFQHFERIECSHQREVKGEWSWLIPPMSPAATHVFHCPYDGREERPNFFYT
jgi:nitric-oxide synthase